MRIDSLAGFCEVVALPIIASHICTASGAAFDRRAVQRDVGIDAGHVRDCCGVSLGGLFGHGFGVRVGDVVLTAVSERERVSV